MGIEGMHHKTRVLHILNELKPSGAETMLRSAASRWRAEGFDLHILSTGSQSGPYAQILEQAGYTIHHVPFSNSPVFLVRVWHLLRRLSPTIVHLHAERGNFRLGVLTCLAGPRTALRTIHSSFQRLGWRRIVRRNQRMVLNTLGVKHVAISTGVHDVELDRFGLRCITLPNWYDSDHFRPPNEDERATARRNQGIPEGVRVLAVVGNCSDVKNHPLLLKALAGLDSSLNWQLLHVGMEEDGYPERTLATELGISERVHFRGPQLDVREFLWASDAFLMPSKVEGFGIAMLEAISCATYAMAANVEGLASLAAEFNQLPLVHNSIPAWTQAIDRALRTPQSRLRSVAMTWAERAVTQFSIDHGARGYQRLYLGTHE